MAKAKKHILTFREFVEAQKNKLAQEPISKEVDWDDRKRKWLAAIEELYSILDKFIVAGYKEAGVAVSTKKEQVTLHENYLGAYNVHNYLIQAGETRILLSPIGTLLVGAYGRVDMQLPRGVVKFVLPEWNQWKIVSGVGSSASLVELDEKNLITVFQQWI